MPDLTTNRRARAEAHHSGSVYRRQGLRGGDRAVRHLKRRRGVDHISGTDGLWNICAPLRQPIEAYRPYDRDDAAENRVLQKLPVPSPDIGPGSLGYNSSPGSGRAFTLQFTQEGGDYYTLMADQNGIGLYRNGAGVVDERLAFCIPG